MRGVLCKRDKSEGTLPKRFCLRNLFIFGGKHDVKLPLWGHLQKNDSLWWTETWFQRGTAHFYTNSKTSETPNWLSISVQNSRNSVFSWKIMFFFIGFRKQDYSKEPHRNAYFFPDFRENEKSYFFVSPLVSVSKMLKK